jgi:uncharacterized protein
LPQRRGWRPSIWQGFRRDVRIAMAWPTLPGAEQFPEELAARLAHAVGDGTGVGHGRARRFVNRLALESSPYLRQHDGNPVNWYPWGDEAFAEAARRHRPIFLSIGYSTCHWCHVMAEESFTDETIAALLNAHYVAIKVDREERPDVDAAYMRAAQALGGGGGWPLSVWLTEGREPFFAGTYFPPYAGGRGMGVGLFESLTRLAELYREEPARVRDVSRTVAQALRAEASLGLPPAVLSSIQHACRVHLAEVVAVCRSAFDERHGGLGSAPKFPSHVPVRLLLRQHQRTDDAQALHMAVATLEAMAAGGIYDHLGGGFHRYATDPAWRVPHFEKMLYDNALLILAYTEAWQATRRQRFARVVRETCEALLGTLAASTGGFCAAMDADSDGEEGRYYVWTEEEIRRELGRGAETDALLRYFGFPGEAETDGGHVLHEVEPDEEVRQTLANARARLLAARHQRVAPQRDEKILSAWNGLGVSALAVAGRVLGELRYVRAAAEAADFVLRELRDFEHGGLLHSICAGRRGGPGFLADHAFVVAGLLDLFQSTGESRWFDAACELAIQLERDFADGEGGGWFDTGPRHERLFARAKSIRDGAEPAGGSVALMNAARLAAFTDDARWHQVVRRALACYGSLFAEQPMAMPEALLAVDFQAGPIQQIVLAHTDRDPTGGQALTRVLREAFCPRTVMVVGDPEADAWAGLAERIPFLRGKSAQEGRATAYMCVEQACAQPTHDAEDFARQLRSARVEHEAPE